jgi:hypothetical protein
LIFPLTFILSPEGRGKENPSPPWGEGHRVRGKLQYGEFGVQKLASANFDKNSASKLRWTDSHKGCPYANQSTA